MSFSTMNQRSELLDRNRASLQGPLAELVAWVPRMIHIREATTEYQMRKKDNRPLF